MTYRIAIVGGTPLQGKSVARILQCAAVEVELLSSADEAIAAAKEKRVMCLGVAAEVLPTLLKQPQALSGVALLVWAGQDGETLLQPAFEVAQINNLFGLRYPDSPPRGWELLSVARRLKGDGLPPLGAQLDWGADVFERTPGSTAELDAVVAEVEKFAAKIIGSRQSATISEVAHELLMNAMYDAPVDAKGDAVYAHNRTAAITLPPSQRPRFLCGCDGMRLVLATVDPFGRLKREHVFGGLHRAAASGGQVDARGGGAGLGFMVMYRTCSMMFCDVVRGVSSQVTVVWELDVPAREQRTIPRSVHFFCKE